MTVVKMYLKYPISNTFKTHLASLLLKNGFIYLFDI